MGLSESDDGVSGRRRIGQPEAGRFDALVAQDEAGYALVTSRHPLDSVFTARFAMFFTVAQRSDNPYVPALGVGAYE
ncbi:hypothetical protein FAF44_44160 [Nonomuraea sp. MG754425]|uniref:hypothetical protein n=1 Tax=Nonomuraea sp. MG754425 TaxID=2570319 RepID=UPI001F331C31|nr:hypothetical protein [Nonomuraea sp. MG754425]MCF6475311.1 hypothetical protein [Nonomuraea sp. MG754425]